MIRPRGSLSYAIVGLSFCLLTPVFALPLLWAQDSRASSRCGADPQEVVSSDSSTQTVGNSYALIIGIAAYKNLPEAAQLNFPGRDATGMYLTLTGLKGGVFPVTNVHLLMNEHATIANIRHEIEEWLPSVAKDNDRVIIYFSGHGFISHQVGYLAAYDTDLNKIAATSYEMDALGAAIGGKIRGKWKVLITDAMHSGAIMPFGEPTTPASTPTKISSSVFLLTGGSDRGQGFEGASFGDGHGVFTYFVMKGLEGEADSNHDGIVDADELSYYVHARVREATNGLQNPTGERGSFDPHMVLAFDPSRAVRTDALPPPLGTLVVSVNIDHTAVLVDGKNVGIADESRPPSSHRHVSRTPTS